MTKIVYRQNILAIFLSIIFDLNPNPANSIHTRNLDDPNVKVIRMYQTQYFL
jgi:hypothetical protein